jgi:fumarate hydratase subunit alpha
MRRINVSKITEMVARLAQEANFVLPHDITHALREAGQTEQSPLARETIDAILKNAGIAEREQAPLCQDCGIMLVFVALGQDAHVTGGDLTQAIQDGVRLGYADGYLRRSVVARPFSERKNTGDNTPAVIYTDIVPGDQVKITLMPKGGGSENMSRLFMLTPAEGREGVAKAVVRAVDEAGSSPCPPVIVGVGVGGTADKAMLLSKKALLRQVGEPNPDPETAALEADLLKRINALGIGAEGFGGTVTALAVHVETFPTHLASLPIGVSILCHSARHKEAVL